ncbi:branched-chain amino acid transport system II carrier protein [Paenibacillus sp. B1-33]|uniref:branched-chain amino acid transport system II carrier protein n=1 Tax=unclassified Paenibacillus TaxID=185978 RepID=UPI003D2D13D6
MTELSKKETFYFGLMLFALFFGAGNLIFPPAVGYAAGSNVWEAMIGFLITSVGLPILGVTAIAKSGDLQSLTNRVHPGFGFVFTFITYLALGPFLVIPRAGSVAFEMGTVPLLPEVLRTSGWSLFVYSFIYFVISYWLCLNPSKLFERIGKVLTPILLIMIILVFIQSMFHPLGEYALPGEAYVNQAAFKGGIDGYSTMDALSALLLGSVVVSALRKRGISSSQKLSAITIKAGLIAGVFLAIIYMMIGYLGSTSHSIIEGAANGGQIMTAIVLHLFGKWGTILLGIVFILACLTTSVGLLAACGEYFHSIVPRISYKQWIGILCIISVGVTNLGLDQIISFSVPIVSAIYPLTIVLIGLTLMHHVFKGRSAVYIGSLLATSLISIVDGLKQAGLEVEHVEKLYRYLPWYSEGLGWVVPALAGATIGCIWSFMRSEPNDLPVSEAVE